MAQKQTIRKISTIHDCCGPAIIFHANILCIWIAGDASTRSSAPITIETRWQRSAQCRWPSDSSLCHWCRDASPIDGLISDLTRESAYNACNAQHLYTYTLHMHYVYCLPNETSSAHEIRALFYCTWFGRCRRFCIFIRFFIFMRLNDVMSAYILFVRCFMCFTGSDKCNEQFKYVTIY